MSDQWYDVPIGARVEPFLQQHADRWFTTAAIAGRAHLTEHMVKQQIAPLVAAGTVETDTDHGHPFYRWKAA